jgi:endonuclease-3
MKKTTDPAALMAELKALYPDARCSLDYDADYQLLFAARLAAQCTDERVNRVTPVLFARYPSLEALAAADVSEVESLIRSCGILPLESQRSCGLLSDACA